MWLTTVNPVNCSEEVQPRLERFQCKAAEVLAAHFLGAPEMRQRLAAMFGLPGSEDGLS
jgi:hypothetical protein